MAPGRLLPRRFERNRRRCGLRRRHRPRGVPSAARAGGSAVRRSPGRVVSDEHALPPRARSVLQAADGDDAPSERLVRAAVQPPARPEGPPLRGALLVLGDRRRRAPLGCDSVRPRQPGKRWRVRRLAGLAVVVVAIRTAPRDCPSGTAGSDVAAGARRAEATRRGPRAARGRPRRASARCPRFGSAR